jgi:hypothetical protein
MLQWALLGIAIVFVVVAYIVIQGTRAALAWRSAAAKGDVKVIAEIVRDALKSWGAMKKPKEIGADVWRGVQSGQLVEVGPDFVRVSCQAESDYRMVDGHWAEKSNPLQAGLEITAKMAEMLFYELPHFQPDRIQIDIYTTYRVQDEMPSRACIVSSEPDREIARAVDWDDWTGEEIAGALGARYRMGERGQPLPIEVSDPKPIEEAIEEQQAVQS